MSHKCSFCKSTDRHIFIDLGLSPVSNDYISPEKAYANEVFYPLTAWVCNKCFLVQVDEFEKVQNIFNENYAYYSSYSSSWLGHAKDYVEMMIPRFNLEKTSRIYEVASNDGYLLQYFQEKGFSPVGIEPALNCAEVARNKGVETVVDFFGEKLAKDLAAKKGKAKLLLGNNVIAHVPDINDFVKGINILLDSEGVATWEFPHLLELIRHNQFDTIYHEHFSYFSVLTISKIFQAHGLRIFDIEKLTTHGGSLRLFVGHEGSGHKTTTAVEKVVSEEMEHGLHNIDMYRNYGTKVLEAKLSFLKEIVNIKSKKQQIAGYGAPAKGNTFLNYCGIGKELIDFTVDANPNKSGKLLPGTHIPILELKALEKNKPAYILILPWNLEEEIVSYLNTINTWGAKYMVAIPQTRIIN